MKGNWTKHIKTVILVTIVLVILFVPAAKATLIQGLMEIGLFKPSIEDKKSELDADLSTIKFKDATGKVISLADLKGKVVFLNFWATWCPPCLAEMPSINMFYEQFKNDKDIVFLMIDADGDFPKAQAYMDRKNYKLPVYTFGSDIPKTLFKGSLPTTVVLDKQGRVSLNGEGAANYASSQFITFIKQLKDLKD
ncbi:TlpA family protein disulfide reductase [Pedobacter polaris]|uniref:TlpA family protein disulfide reductase n=1 Tax=Pedobacter polaris TaxID=2571273 RepID=A0A4V5P2G8_9SPHI|nr:TlpA disulfide reductase family protein [Pedobacter polaris]TKC12712.1 TlpA family protein disulfide reductase [Pedobacter polaris]